MISREEIIILAKLFTLVIVTQRTSIRFINLIFLENHTLIALKMLTKQNEKKLSPELWTLLGSN